jgi:hypothetical protein
VVGFFEHVTMNLGAYTAMRPLNWDLNDRSQDR